MSIHKILPEAAPPFHFHSYLSETFDASQQLSPFPSWSADYGTTIASNMSPIPKLDDNALLPFSENQPQSLILRADVNPLSSTEACKIALQSHPSRPSNTDNPLLPTFVSSVPAITLPPNAPTMIHPTPVRVSTDAPTHQPSLPRHSDGSTSNRVTEPTTAPSLFCPTSISSPPESTRNLSAAETAPQILVKTIIPPVRNHVVTKTPAKKVTNTRAKRVPKSQPKPQPKSTPAEDPLPSSSSLRKRELQNQLDYYERLFSELDTLMARGQVSLEGRLKQEIHDIVRRKNTTKQTNLEQEQKSKISNNSANESKMLLTQQAAQANVAAMIRSNENSSNHSSFDSSSTTQFHYSDQYVLQQQQLQYQPHQQQHPLSMFSRQQQQMDLSAIFQLQQRQLIHQLSTKTEEELQFVPSYPQQQQLQLQEDHFLNSFPPPQPSLSNEFRAVSPFKKRKMEHDYVDSKGAYPSQSQLSMLSYSNRRDEPPAQSIYRRFFASRQKQQPVLVAAASAADLSRAVQYRPMSRQGSEHSDIAAFQYLHVNGATPAISLPPSNPYFTRF